MLQKLEVGDNSAMPPTSENNSGGQTQANNQF